MACLGAEGLCLMCVLLWNRSPKPRSNFPSQALALAALAGPTGAWGPPGHAQSSWAHIQKQTLFIFIELWDLLKKKGILRHSWVKHMTISRADCRSLQPLLPLSPCLRSFSLVGCTLWKGCSTRDAGPNYLLLTKELSPEGHILFKRPLTWQPTTKRWSPLPVPRPQDNNSLQCKGQATWFTWNSSLPSLPDTWKMPVKKPDNIACSCAFPFITHTSTQETLLQLDKQLSHIYTCSQITDCPVTTLKWQEHQVNWQ